MHADAWAQVALVISTYLEEQKVEKREWVETWLCRLQTVSTRANSWVLPHPVNWSNQTWLRELSVTKTKWDHMCKSTWQEACHIIDFLPSWPSPSSPPQVSLSCLTTYVTLTSPSQCGFEENKSRKEISLQATSAFHLTTQSSLARKDRKPLHLRIGNTRT